MLRVTTFGVLLMLVAPLLTPGVLAEAPANEHFERTWARTDLPVSAGEIARTWMWGPEAFTAALNEPYAEGAGGQRSVQYFDKARMEITDPSADASSIWYVTNGLLVVEMVTGQMQVGNNQFEERTPADVNIAGDANDPNSPTYAALAQRLDDEAAPEQSLIKATIDGSGNLDPSATFGAAYNVLAAHHVPETGHTIAAPFWDFMNSSGLVYTNGAYLEAPLFENAYFATGFPIGEAYWTEIQVGGTLTQVLLQCFERRCLTYTPSNDAAWQVEAGNVGQHYYAWRYAGDPPDPDPGEEAELECVALGYPCSLAESSSEALDLIFSYGETMVEMMESGTSLADLLTWISAQPDVAEARGDDELIRYRVDGGYPAWVYDSRIYTPGSEPAALSLDNDLSMATSSVGATPDSMLPANVVGKDLNSDGFTDDKPKRALVLSPFEYSFAPWDASGEIAEMLRQTRGYDEAGNVQEFRNSSRGDQNVGVSHFMGWNAFSVIYVSSHGGESCGHDELYGCDSFISTGERVSRETANTASQQGSSAVFPGFIETASGYIGVSNDFFRDQYGLGGIENTIIYIDSCRSYSDSSIWNNAGTLPSLLSGFDSVVFGWERSVGADHSADSARLIFSSAIEDGTPIAKSFGDFYADIVNDGSDDAVLHVTAPESLGGDSVDLRIRETVTQIDTLTGEALEDGSPIPIIGALGDGKPDELPIAIQVDGVDDDPSKFIVHVRVNDEDLPVTFTLADGEQIGGGLGGPLTGFPIFELKDKRASLGRDISPGEELKVMIWIELPEGGETKQTLNSPPGNPLLYFRSTIRSEAPAGGFEAESIVTAEMPLMLNADLDGIEPATYELIYESYSVAVPGTPCTLESVRHNGTIEIVDVEFPVDSETGKLSSFVPDYVVLRPNPDIYAETLIICPQGSFVMPGQDIHWYSGFVVLHEAELEQSGFRFSNWQEGSDEAYAESNIERSRTDGVNVEGELQMEVRKP